MVLPVRTPYKARREPRITDPTRGEVASCYLGSMSTAVARKRGPGQPTKLTDEVRRTLITALGAGAPIKTACAVAGVSETAYYAWMQRGRGEHPELAQTPKYKEFWEAVERAIGRGDLELLASVRSTVRGKACGACAGSGSLEVDEGLQRCPVCMGTTYAVRPDGRLGLQVLAARHPAEFGRKDRVEVDQKVAMQVDVRSAALTVNLADLSPEQLRALTAGAPLEIEASEG